MIDLPRLFGSRAPAATLSADPVRGGLLGAYRIPNPAGSLRDAGYEPVWHDETVAFGGTAIGFDAAESLVVAGDIHLDNVRELRTALSLLAASEHELLAELLRRDGPAGLLLSRGLFAGAAWDRRNQKLTLFRDAVGSRTIYAGQVGRGRWFGNRLATVRRQVPTDIALAALRDYLCYSFVPGEQTMWRNIREPRPGAILELPSDRSISYWEPAELPWDNAEPIEGHARRLRPLLDRAVEESLPESGEVGVFLSGGLDSSLVAALAVRLSGRPVNTYAIHFGPGYANELEFSSLVAEHCGIRHEVLELPSRPIMDELAPTLAALDDPIGDPLTVPNFLLGRRAARDVSVILNGEGGDPCFGGPKNGPMLLNELYSIESREAAYLRSFQKCFEDLAELLTPDARALLAATEPPEKILEPFFAGERMPDFVNRLMYINVRLKGADHILTKVSNLTSANGLLGRSPLFDQRIVEASFGIPPEFKLAGTDEKAVLKAAVADLLPERILTRPKSGMLVPVQRWFRRDMKHLARDLLLAPDARTRSYLNQALIRDWLEYRGDLWPRQGVKIWLVLTLEVWLRVHG